MKLICSLKLLEKCVNYLRIIANKGKGKKRGLLNNQKFRMNN